MVPRTRLITSGLNVSRLGLGLSRLHYLRSERERRYLIDAALDLGLTHFDTARIYGDGIAERSLGEALREHRSSVTIATKFGLLPNRLFELAPQLSLPLRAARSALRRVGTHRGPRRSWDVKTLRGSLAASLQALRTDYLDILFLHDPRPDEVIARDDLLQALEAEKALGRFRFLGLATGYAHARAILSEMRPVFDVIQVPETEWMGEEPVPDITFGALDEGPQIFRRGGLDSARVHVRLVRALARRPDGAVLVGTTDVSHLRQLADVAATCR